ncbi:MAG: helix-turn-helix domain-containing protein [Lactobacillus sp.]|nr:helix-turn-helix domain-containing protein [Lactobacillus sp.]
MSFVVNRIYAVLIGEFMKIGDILKYYRHTHKLTQSQVAEMSGINEKYLGRIERNESVPTIDKIEQLCVAFDIRIQDFLATDIKSATHTAQSNYFNTKNNDTLFYCNCCGFTFKVSYNNNKDDIRCPECDCLYNIDNDYIETYIS